MDKRCPKCGETKALKEFRVRGYSRRPGTKPLPDTYCRDCRRATARQWARQKLRENPDFLEAERGRKRDYARRPEVIERKRDRYRDGRPVKLCALCGERLKMNWYAVCSACAARVGGQDRLSHVRRDYGLSPRDYLELILGQGGRCAACGRALEHRRGPAGICVDHDHATGAIRGLLCLGCNSAAGQLRDDWRVAYALGRYLRSWAKRNPLNQLYRASGQNETDVA